jgi:hypothetical protein
MIAEKGADFILGRQPLAAATRPVETGKRQAGN